MSTIDRAVVVGLGNPLMGDDAFGLRALARLGERWELPAGVDVVDGGTWGLTLLPLLEDAHRVLFLDAARTNAAPGSVVELRDDEIPRRLSTLLSSHQVDLRELLAVAQLRGSLPERITVIGVEPSRIELGAPLTEAVEAALDTVVALAVAELARWGVVCAPRPATEGAAACTS